MSEVKVTRADRLYAYTTFFGREPPVEDSPGALWVEDGRRVDFPNGPMLMRIAGARAAGYAACQEDVVAYIGADGSPLDAGSIAEGMERGEHVGVATSESEP